MLITRDAVAAVELIVYVPSIFLTIYTSLRYGFTRQLGWFYLMLFCLIRVAGAAMEILSSRNEQSLMDRVWASVLSTVGLGPLLLATLGLLRNARKSVTDKASNCLNSAQILQLPCFVAVFISIWGGIWLSNNTTRASGEKLMEAGLLIFIAIFVSLMCLATLTLQNIRNLPNFEKRALIVVLVALPFLFVRLLYTTLVGFKVNGAFSVVKGNPVIYLCMAAIEEVNITIMFLVIGLTTPPAVKFKSEMARRVSHGRMLKNSEGTQFVGGIESSRLPHPPIEKVKGVDIQWMSPGNLPRKYPVQCL